MTYRREAWNRFLSTIISQIPPFISQYSSHEQEIITPFYNLLAQNKVDTHKQRDCFLEEMKILTNEYYNSNRYIETPFLWFSVTFFLNAQRLLIEASFHADTFIQYLVKVLRGDGEALGVFQLLRQQTSVNDIKWEKLQYYCNTDLSDPLTEEQLEIIKVLYTLVNKTPIQGMNQYYITKEISEKVLVSKKFRGLHHFFSRLDARWGVWMFPPAFDLSLVMFMIKIHKSNSNFDLNVLKLDQNFVMGMSNVYQLLKEDNIFSGFVYVPKRLLNVLIEYFKENENNNRLEIIYLEPITSLQAGTSLAFYLEGTGWERQVIPSTFLNSVESRGKFNTDKVLESLSSITPKMKLGKFTYNDLDAPEQAIKLYIKTFSAISFANLPIGLKGDFQNSAVTQSDLALLSKFFAKKIASSTFQLRNALSEFSLDMFWMEIPQNSSRTTQTFLHWFPMSSVISTKDKCVLITQLTPNIFNWVKKKLGWNIFAIQPIFRSKVMIDNYYNYQDLQWMTPELLE